MLNRRRFLTQGSLGALLVGLGLPHCQPNQSSQESKKTVKPSFPVSIATWSPNQKATALAGKILSEGKRALDAVEAAIKIPEADPEDTSVGYGGLPDREGMVTLDACIMNELGQAGAVTFLQNIMHPISVARLVMEKTPHVMLSGEGAHQFALSEGFKKENLLTEKSKKAWEEWKLKAEYKPIINVERHDTIGLLALDQKQNLSGGCSTSGMAYKMHGRVGDSPIIGAGLFVDNEIGAATGTGLGEAMMRVIGSFLIVEMMRIGKSPQEACEIAIQRIIKLHKNHQDFQVGVIALNKQGEHGAFAIQKGFNYALFKGGKNEVFEAGFAIK
jgi:N4-(beta-N-acetylglucosaminyl)-L-asparaginase